MNIKLQKQIEDFENVKGVSKKDLEHDPNKTYYSGRKVKEGDKFLYALLVEDITIEDKIPLKLISLHQHEYGTVYEDHETEKYNKSGVFPYLKLKL